MSMRRMTWPKAARAALIVGASLGLGACGGDMTDLEQYVGEVKARPGGRIDPLPTVEPYASYGYASNNLRSPFVPEKRLRQAGPASNGIRPNENRNREFLESFPLDTLRMVGSLQNGGNNYALIQGSDGLIHRVQPGNYLGENDGRITQITNSEIIITEIVPDGLGGYLERPAAIALND
ncbi:MAG: pilus assembly protein PilP [Gammaproteobacteria bacterium]